MKLKLTLLTLILITLLSSCSLENITQKNTLKIQNLEITSDLDNDGINDIQDLVTWARAEVKNKTNYKSAYYSGGYPPENEWVCTDVVWRAFRDMWVNLKDLVDEDIRKNTKLYTRTNGKPDTNIDFRRVPNLEVFFSRHAEVLTTEMIPGNKESMEKWQPWDIVTFWQPNQHVAIVSDKRDKNWAPYLIHNYAYFPKEDVWVWYIKDKKQMPIRGHYRWKYGE